MAVSASIYPKPGIRRHCRIRRAYHMGSAGLAPPPTPTRTSGIHTATFVDRHSLGDPNNRETKTGPGGIRDMQQVPDRRAGRQNDGRRGQAGRPIHQQALRERRRGMPAQGHGRGCGAVRARGVGCRRTAATLRTNGGLCKKPGLASVPSKGAMGNAYRRIPKPYLQALNGIITGARPRSVAGDSKSPSAGHGHPGLNCAGSPDPASFGTGHYRISSVSGAAGTPVMCTGTSSGPPGLYVQDMVIHACPEDGPVRILG